VVFRLTAVATPPASRLPQQGRDDLASSWVRVYVKASARTPSLFVSAGATPGAAVR
jgi:hypothetical protein